MSNFDPDAFMTKTVDQPLQTEYTLCPPGEYPAVIDDFKAGDALKQYDFEYKQGPRAGQPGTMTRFSIPFVINDDKVKAEMGMERVIVYMDVALDLGPDGGLDWGKNKNIDLGRIREAVNQNGTGSWGLGNLRGAGPVMVKVERQTFERKDKSKGEKSVVTKVVRMS